MVRSVCALVLVLAQVLAGPGQAVAAERPLWELGLGGGVISLPYYRGAADNRVLPVPLVYPVYRGEVLKVDEDGVRGLFFDSERVRLDLSADGTVPASDDDVEGREGMPALDLTFQIGPSLAVDLWESRRRARRLTLTLPVRAVFALDSRPSHIGFAASPKLTYYRDVRFAGRYWRLGLTGGIELGSDELHDYFYSVAPRFQTAARPRFDADGGYAGTRFTLGAQGRRGNNWIGAFLRYDNVGGAVFEDSPLVRREGNFAAGVVVGWFVAQSKRMVTVPSDETLRY